MLDKILEQDNPYEALLEVHSEIEEMAELLMNHRKKLPDINTADDAIERIKNAKRVLVVSGAGLSVSSGIPDFRSPGGTLNSPYLDTLLLIISDFRSLRSNSTKVHLARSALFVRH